MPIEKDENKGIHVLDQSSNLFDFKIKIINLNSSDCYIITDIKLNFICRKKDIFLFIILEFIQ